MSIPSREDALKSGLKWFPYNKGGGFKKWYGNNEYLVNWENDGFEICNFRDDKGKQKSRPQNMEWFFKQGLSWCKITSSSFSMRFIPQGFLFDVAGCTLFVDEKDIYYVLGYMNSKVNDYILGLISPTLNYEVGHVGSLPIVFSDIYRDEVEALVRENIRLCKEDWDSYENSWDYQRNKAKYDTKPVEVGLLSASRKISNMIFSLNFYQKDAVGDNRSAANYLLYFVDSNGKQISDTAKIIADKTSDNGQERTFRCSFNLKSLKYDNRASYYLVIADETGLQMPQKEEFQIDIAFAVDEFDFFS